MKLEDLLTASKKTPEIPTVKEIDDLDKMIATTEIPVIPDYLINDPEVVGYPSFDLQSTIYNWVAEDLPIHSKYSVKDFGAGRGDFSQYISKGTDYIGFETKTSLVLAGKQKRYVNLINEDFMHSDLITDYTICIGTLNEDHGNNKWEYFNKTLNHAINTTKTAIIFVLSSNMDGLEGFLDYPIDEIIQNMPKGLRFNIDYTRLEDIYKLTVHIGGYNV
jgi:hypothetical protein